MAGGTSGSGIGAGRSACGHRQSERAHRAVGCEADADGKNRRGLLESENAGVFGYGIELGACAGRGGRGDTGGGKGQGGGTLHSGKRGGELDFAKDLSGAGGVDGRACAKIPGALRSGVVGRVRG